MKLSMKQLFWIIAPCLLIFGAFSVFQNDSVTIDKHGDNARKPERRQLRRSFFEKREVLVVYGALNKSVEKRYHHVFEGLSQLPIEGNWRNFKVRFKEVKQLHENEIGTNILILVGTPEGNPLLKRMLTTTPFRIEGKEIRLGQKSYSSQRSVLSIGMYPNAENDSLPLGIITAEDSAEILTHLEKKIEQNGRSFFMQNMDFELHRDGLRSVMGDFGVDWKMSPTTFFDFSSGNDLVYRSEHFNFVNHRDAISREDLNTLIPNVEETTVGLLDFLEVKKELPKITYHIYKSAEEKGLVTGNTAQAHFKLEDNSVHTVINDKYQNNFIQKENDLLVRHLIGKSNLEVFQQGLAIYFTKQWQNKGYKYWTAHLFGSGNALSLEELFNDEMLSRESPLIVDCLSASLVTFLIDIWGKKAFLEHYSNWNPSPEEIDKLEPRWQAYLKDQFNKTNLQSRQANKLPYLKGFNFAHEGYGIYNGYISKKATESIKKQAEIGANALALVPYTFMRDSKSPSPFRFSDSANDENDESLVHAFHEAKKMGMFTMLKPQVWVGNGWPGEIEMSDEANWLKFFDNYYRWIRHYAFLAEIHQMDALCVGVEFTKASLSHGDKWRKIIDKTKGLFQGNLTYAANWGIEFETIDFWDELDFIGLNSYYPLSKNDEPSDEELEINFKAIKTKIKTVQDAFKKPVVFTEIGFRSIDMPWKNPHAEGNDSFNEAHQKRCYEVIFRGIANEPWCQGILWWKFPSYLEYRGRENSAFTPNNKMAEETVREWFSK